VDALSGHEDGLLAIAEKLMEHYDAGYDVMGEAIIDAFADVQKLFQHVVEAAHMEGAAFEASRREAEMAILRKQAAAAAHYPILLLDDDNNDPNNNGNSPPAASGPTRHDEFVDQDVKDVLTEAIRQGSVLREAGMNEQHQSSSNNKHMECYQLYEQACQSASALLPVDSDHRGRLQLSIARAESMSPDRACAILRYAMDDVLRSGLRAGKTPLPDPSKRADVVLSRPKPLAGSGLASSSGIGIAIGGSGGAGNSGSGSSAILINGQGVVGAVQSSDEALASLMEEMKEILGAPVYNDTPLQSVAKRFWTALQEAQKTQQKNEERLEQALGKLKGEFLLARAEWEEKLNATQEQLESMQQELDQVVVHNKEHSAGAAAAPRRAGSGEEYMQQARQYSAAAMKNHSGNSSSTNNTSTSSSHQYDHGSGMNGNSSHGQNYPRSSASQQHRANSVASLGSGLAIHAKKLVNSINDFNCNALNERNGLVTDDDNIDDLQMHNHSNTTRNTASSSSHHHHQSQHYSPHPDRYGSSHPPSNPQRQQPPQRRNSPQPYQGSSSSSSRRGVVASGTTGSSGMGERSRSGSSSQSRSHGGSSGSHHHRGATPPPPSRQTARTFRDPSRSPQRMMDV
jgi:prefoldin subunit 5